VAQFESLVCLIPNRGAVQPLRLKNGSARDDVARKRVKLNPTDKNRRGQRITEGVEVDGI